MFNNRNIHKMTWKSPDASTFNQIDHLIIDARHVSNLLDVRSFRGANIGSDYLAISKIRGRICNLRKTSGYQPKKFNVGKLKEQDVKIVYAQRIEGCLTDFNDSESINEEWKALRDIITTTADAVLGKAGKMEQNNWFDTECEQMITIKNEAYRKMQQKNHTRMAVEEYCMARREE
jgi:hypothetical protein